MSRSTLPTLACLVGFFWFSSQQVKYGQLFSTTLISEEENCLYFLKKYGNTFHGNTLLKFCVISFLLVSLKPFYFIELKNRLLLLTA